MEKSVHTKEYLVLRRLLRETRELANVTQAELATRLGQTQSFISKCERGELRLDVIQLRSFCTALNTDLASFIRTLENRLTNEGKHKA
jgi:transcriptional regulator with XRE-family HTH domain